MMEETRMIKVFVFIPDALPASPVNLAYLMLHDHAASFRISLDLSS